MLARYMMKEDGVRVCTGGGTVCLKAFPVAGAEIFGHVIMR